MNTYIVNYAHKDCNGNYSLQDVRIARIFSEGTKEQVKIRFQNKCEIMSCDLVNYNGTHIEVYLLEDFLEMLPTDRY